MSKDFYITIDQNLPLISCLCVTQYKVKQLKRAINCFNSQTYINKELIIMYEDNDKETQNYIESYGETENIYCIEVPAEPKMTLGELRNCSIASCNGEYFANGTMTTGITYSSSVSSDIKSKYFLNKDGGKINWYLPDNMNL